MVAISVPGISLVSADLVYKDLITVTDNMGYTTFADTVNWSMETGNHTEAVIDEGNIKYSQIQETRYKKDGVTKNGEWSGALKYTFPEITVAEDTDNKTRITTNQYKGKVEVALTYDIEIIDEEKSNPFFYISVNGNQNFVQNRTYNTYSTVYNGADSSTYKVGSIGDSNSRTETFTIDTFDKSANATDGTKSYDFTVNKDVKYLPNFTVTSHQRCDVGTYATFKKVEVKVQPSISADEKTKFESLKAKLVDDVDNVSADIDLSGFEGVTWSSTNPDAISTTGKVTQKVGETQNATLIATFEVDGVTYNKEYDMVVAAGTEVTPDPDPGDEPEDKPESGVVISPDGTVQISDYMGYKSFAEAQANGWSYEESDYTEVSVNTNGNIVHKQIAEDTGTENVGNLTYKFPELTILEDTVNNTVLKTNNYRGNLTVTIAHNVSSTSKGSAYLMTIGGDTKSALKTESGYSNFTAKNSSSSTLTESGGTKTSIFKAGDRNTVYTMDSSTGAVTAYEAAATGKYNYVSGTSEFNFVSEISLYAKQNTPKDSTFVFKGITINASPQTLTDGEIAEINTIVPETLASTDGKVYEDINLGAYENVIWKSSDTNVITDDGVIKKIKGQEQTVELTATFKTSFGLNYNKTYKLTVAAGNNTVMFYSEGEEYNYQDIVMGEKVVKPADPVKDGYTFDGWYTDAPLTEAYDFDSPVTDDLNLYAKFVINTYKVYFRVNSIIDESLTINVPHNTAVGALPAVPVQTGKTAIGWVMENSGNQLLAEDVVLTSDLYVDAAYSEAGARQYKVTFMNGTEVHKEIYAWPGYTIEFPEEVPLKTNYTFVRWERGGVEFKETDLMIARDIVIDAVFTPNSVEIKFYTDENTLYKTETGYYDTAFGALPADPSASGKAFNGWKTLDGTVFNAETIVTGPINVYAVWGVPTVIVDEDITQYTSATTGLIKFDLPENKTITASFNDGLRIYQSAWEPLNTSGAKNPTFGTDFIGYIRSLVSEDAVNRNKVYMNSLVGEYEIELKYQFNQINPTEYDGVSLGTGFWQMYTGKSDGAGGYAVSPYNVRLQNIESGNKSSSIYVSSTNKGSLPFESTFKLDHSYTVRFNTYTAVATAWNDNPANSPKGGQLDSIENAIDVFSVSNMFRTGIGSFYVLKNVKVTEYYTDRDSLGYKQSMGVIETLPAKLGDEDPNAITKDIEMPSTEGVVWSSSDESIITADGKVTPWYDDTDVVLTATATSEDGAYVYSKEYTVTVKGYVSQKENLTIDMSEGKWDFYNRAGAQEGKYSVGADGSLKVEKITEAINEANQRENKTFFAYLDLYGEVSNDQFTATSTNTYSGVYDITLDIENNVTSTVPMNVALGYRNGDTFFSTATLKFNKDSIKLYYPDGGETNANAVVYAAAKSPAKLKVRIDTDLNFLSVWLDDVLIFKNYPYVSPFPALSGYDMFGTVRIGMDTNNNIGDYITIKNVEFEKLVNNESSIANATLAVADGIKAEDLFATPDNVTGDLNLPKTVGDYVVDWSTESDQIDVKTGEVFFSNVAKDIVLTAHIYNGSAQYPAYVKKDFKLKIAAGNSAEYGEYLINALGDITNQDYADIRYDLNLPVSSDVVWTVSPSGIIGNDGKFVANAVVYEPTEVTVTASAYGSTKDYKLTVAPRSGNNELFKGTLPATLTYGTYKDLKLSHSAMVEFELENSDKTGKIELTDHNDNVIMSVIVEDGYFYFDHKGTDYKKYFFVSDAPKSIKIMALSDIQKLAIWIDGELVVDYADYKTDAAYLAKATITNDTIRYKNFKISTDDFGMLQLNVDNINYFTDFDMGVIGGNINLSNAAITGDKVEWMSENTSLLTNTGIVTLPSALTVTNLGFKVTDVNNDKVSINKSFELIVTPDEAVNLAKGAEIKISKLENMTYPKKNLNDNDYHTVHRVVSAGASESDIIFDFGGEKVLNAMLLVEEAGNIRNITVNVSNDNATWTPVFAGDIANVANGIVKFDIVTAKYVKLTINNADSTNVDINEIKFYLSATAAELAQMDINALTLPGSASANLNLATKGVNGSTITWTSSHPSIISSTGVVTRPDEGTTVTLTATIMADGTPYTKAFNVYVSNAANNGPTVVPGAGGGGGGGAGGGGASANTGVTIGNDVTEPVYAEPVVSDDATTDNSHYADVKADDWYYDAVMTLTEKGIVSGDGTGAFSPNDKVTREQFLKMLLVTSGVETDNAENTFADVNTTAWYADYVLTAKKLNIVSGMSASEFGIGAQIS